MKLLVSYSNPWGNWYVGEFYNRFHNLLCEKGHDVEFISTEELCNKHGGQFNYTSTVPSVFNIYNLIIQNKKNNKTFLHSWHDYAPAIMDTNFESGITKFDVVKFACTSGLTQPVYDRFKDKFQIQPSFYLLEHLTDHNLIETNKSQPKDIKKAFFNGLNYGKRQILLQKFKQSKYFSIRVKSDSTDFQQKDEYFKTLGQHKYALGLDGAALICYRDLEAFGIGCLLLREKIQNLFYEPLIEGEHYFNIFDDYAYSVIFNDDNLLLDHIENKIEQILSLGDSKLDNVISNARSWFERNCLLDNQLKLMYSFLEELSILE
jgi:hypothetical protein